MEKIDVLKAQIVRNDLATPWGFRLQGGADQGQPITIMRVTPGSPANSIGIKSGDEVTHISNRCTKHMTTPQADDLIAQHNQTLVLTLERRASGSVPMNPLLTPPPEAEPPGEAQTTYQPPYDTYSPASAAAPGPQPPHYQQSPQQYDFQKIQSRPFTAPPGPRQPVSPPTSPQDYQTLSQAAPAHGTPGPYYHEPQDVSDSNVSQSRTFKSLQSLMRNEEPGAGVYGLPPPRSAYMERTKQEEAERKRQAAASGQRVKVFMPQQYNSPMGMYSAKNVVDSFQTQAEGYYDQQEKTNENVSQNQAYGVSEL